MGCQNPVQKVENHPHTDTRWILDISHVFNLGPLILFKAKGTKRNTNIILSHPIMHIKKQPRTKHHNHHPQTENPWHLLVHSTKHLRKIFFCTQSLSTSLHVTKSPSSVKCIMFKLANCEQNSKSCMFFKSNSSSRLKSQKRKTFTGFLTPHLCRQLVDQSRLISIASQSIENHDTWRLTHYVNPLIGI